MLLCVGLDGMSTILRELANKYGFDLIKDGDKKGQEKRLERIHCSREKETTPFRRELLNRSTS